MEGAVSGRLYPAIVLGSVSRAEARLLYNRVLCILSLGGLHQTGWRFGRIPIFTSLAWVEQSI